jgi:hypothetical protein
MLEHATHATATFAELTLAISLGLMMKIIRPDVPPDDLVDKETRAAVAKATTDNITDLITQKQNRFVACVYGLAVATCDKSKGIWETVKNIFVLFWQHVHWVTAMIAVVTLIGLAFCPLHEWQFWCSITAFCIATVKGWHVHRTPGALKPHQADVPVEPA